MKHPVLHYLLVGLGLALISLKSGAAQSDLVALDPNYRGNWQVRSGEWVFGDNDLKGSGDSAMDLKGPFEPPFTLDFRLKVMSGQRPRVVVGSVTLANEGSKRILQLTTGATFAYKLNQEYEVSMEVRNDGVDVSIDGKKELSLAKIVGPIPVITFRSGDYFSKGTSHFGDIVIRTPRPPVAAEIAASVPGNSAQSCIAILSAEAPNALEWVLAPLNRAIPPDIRQNLTFLREDLLDEAAKKPAADADAYQFGKQLCDSLIATLDERDKAQVHAGYTGAQANANISVTNQALEARRSYKMSWPQYRREKDQRNELQRELDAHAALAKERPAVEWSERGNQIRAMVDSLYAKYREAARRSPTPKS